ncbi:MAG: ASCH domain-containing protein [Candidatus Promineifilaceae bacterium]|nr:ASCH domain-containing protein [Candidatus Promineifilaceae bacterium]
MKSRVDIVGEFWRAYRDTLPVEHPHHERQRPLAWGFGDSSALADELGLLTLSGRKRATATMLEELIANGELLPQIGELNIILDGSEQPLCLIETIDVQVLPFDQVDEQFARDEGEGDGSLTYWQDAHTAFFGRVAERLGTTLQPTTPIVCERFRLLYPQPDT